MNNYFSFILMLLLCNRMYSQAKYYKYKQQIDSVLINDTLSWKYQLGAYDYSIIGEYALALKTWDEPRRDYKTPVLKVDLIRQFSAYNPQLADGYILEKAGKTNLLIINEAHHQPRHRVFTESLLKKLYEEGYRYIGFETLDSKDSLLNTRKYPVETSGYYSNEPSFGNLIRTALRLGYTVFPYEAKGNGETRETGEANNIKAFMDKNNNGKYVIHCGFDHAIEDSTHNDWKLAMAGRLKVLTGIDPLTIDQVQLTETSDPGFDNAYRQEKQIAYSAVFIAPDGDVFHKASRSKTFDLNVYHPDTKYRNGRPDWLYRMGYTPYPFFSKITIELPCLVYAYIQSEYPNGVPVDVISLEKTDTDKCLILPDKNQFVIVCKNQKGQLQYIELK
jgi:hypothetical protein